MASKHHNMLPSGSMTPNSNQHPSSMSRASSTGSLYTGGSAANTDGPTDDEDSDGRSGVYSHGTAASASPGMGSMSYRERRREAHTQAEQKRRDAIKKGYDYLQELVPTIMGTVSGAESDGPTSPPDEMPSGAVANGKVSKATVLQKSIDYINYVQQQKKKQEEELAELRKEVAALQIMRANYEQLVKAHQSHPAGGDMDLKDGGDQVVPSDVKFEVFRTLMDTLFDSFNERVSMNHFSELSACVISWIEDQCKPAILQENMYHILQKVKEKYQQKLSDQDQMQQLQQPLPSHGQRSQTGHE